MRISLLDYTNFMRRARWKADSRPTRHTAVGNYLSILDPPSLRTTHTPQARHTFGWLPLEVIDTLSAAWPARLKINSHRLIYIPSTRYVRGHLPSILKGIHNPYTSAYAIRTERVFCGNFYTQDAFWLCKSVSQGLTTINGSFYKKNPDWGDIFRTSSDRPWGRPSLL